MKGFFITFEGIDGCGKTTQCRLLSDFLTKIKKDHISIREPGATQLGEKLRPIIQDPQTKITSYTEVYLYAACRCELLQTIIKPALELNKIVICDRFLDSSLAYQGFSRGIGMDVVKNINQFAVDGVTPDITFFLDIPIDLAQTRLTKLDRIELEGAGFQTLVQQGYKQLAKENSRIITIDGSQTPQKIHEQILSHIDNQCKLERV